MMLWSTPLSVAPSSGGCHRHEFSRGRHAPAAGPRSHRRLHWTITFLLMQNFYQHSIFPADYHFVFVYAKIRSSLLITILFLFMQKLRKRWRQYWQVKLLAMLETAIFDHLFTIDRLVVVKFHTNIANGWLFMIPRKITAIILCS